MHGIRRILVAGIGTDVGKTTIAAILTHLFEADYFKPISSGSPDSSLISELLGDWPGRIHKENYHFSHSLSPHHAAKLEGITPDPSRIQLPKTDRMLIIESAGGLLVPLNDSTLTVDLYSKWECAWILVSKNQLGSINHSLLTIEAMKRRNLPLLGLIFNGPENPHSESFILSHTKLELLARMDEEREITPTTIKRYSDLWKAQPFYKKILLSQAATREPSGTPSRRPSQPKIPATL